MMKTKTISILLPALLMASSLNAAQIERSYPGSGCTAQRHADLFPDEATGGLPFADQELDMYRYSSNGSVAAANSPSIFFNGGGGNDDSGIHVYCPVQREKVGTGQTAGAKFFAYVNRQGLGAVSCTLASTKAHNGVIVSSGTRTLAAGVGSDGEQLLQRSTGPGNAWGPYVFSCHLRGFSNPGTPFAAHIPTSLYSYRIREF